MNAPRTEQAAGFAPVFRAPVTDLPRSERPLLIFSGSLQSARRVAERMRVHPHDWTFVRALPDVFAVWDRHPDVDVYVSADFPSNTQHDALSKWLGVYLSGGETR